MPDETAAAPVAPPNKLTELDRLKMTLAREKASRVQAQGVNLQMLQQQQQQAAAAVAAENQAVFDSIKATYRLEPADQIGEDGTITRAPKG